MSLQIGSFNRTIWQVLPALVIIVVVALASFYVSHHLDMNFRDTVVESSTTIPSDVLERCIQAAVVNGKVSENAVGTCAEQALPSQPSAEGMRGNIYGFSIDWTL